MRKVNFSNILFPKTRLGILSATYGQPDRSWYLSEIAAWLQTAPSSLQRELESLTKAGILRNRRDGNRMYYQAETNSPIFAPLKELIAQISGVIPAIKEQLGSFETAIEICFVYGSLARGDEKSGSDVDILFVGSVGLAALSPVIRKLEDKFRREFDLKCYSTEEFKKKVQTGNHFLIEVIKNEKIFILGNESVLEKITGSTVQP